MKIKKENKKINLNETAKEKLENHKVNQKSKKCNINIKTQEKVIKLFNYYFKIASMAKY